MRPGFGQNRYAGDKPYVGSVRGASPVVAHHVGATPAESFGDPKENAPSIEALSLAPGAKNRSLAPPVEAARRAQLFKSLSSSSKPCWPTPRP